MTVAPPSRRGCMVPRCEAGRREQAAEDERERLYRARWEAEHGCSYAEKCQGCDYPAAGSEHRFSCGVHGARALHLPVTQLPDGRFDVALPGPKGDHAVTATLEPAGARFVIDHIRHTTAEVNSLRHPNAADAAALAALAPLAADALDCREVPMPDDLRACHRRPHDAGSAVVCVWSTIDLTRALAVRPEGGTLPAATVEAIRHAMRSLCAAIDYAVTRHKETP